MKKTLILAAAASLASAPAVLANDVLQIDVDALTAVASGAFSDTFSGTLHVFNSAADEDINENAEILDVLIDGNAQGTGGAGVGDFSFDMFLTFNAGSITGGTIQVAVDQGGSENTYDASVAATSDGSILDIGGTFLIGGLTFDGTFASPAGTFLGVDISPWGVVQPVPGNFAQIAFNPNQNNIDADTDVDVFIAIPTPAGAAMAGLGLLGVAARRRRA